MKLKTLIIILISLLSIFAISIITHAAENDIEITLRPIDENVQILIDVKSKESLKSIKIYKEIENGKYNLFYQSNNISQNNATFSISHKRLSEDKETHIRIIVRDGKGNQVVKDLTLPKYQKPTPTPQVSQAPEPTPSPTPTPTQSTNPTPTQSPAPTPTPSIPPTNQEISISLDKTVLMLDKNHYSFSILNTKISPTNAEVSFSSSDKKVVKVNSKTGKINAVGYGTANVVATATLNGKSKKATCKVRVITTMKEKTSDSGAFVNTRESNGPKTYYIRGYKNKNSRSKSWTDEEVESYINNAAWILKTYPDKYSEGKKRTYYYYPTNSASQMYTATRKKGEIAPNEYLLLFTSKNQWLYLLKKDSKGKWKINEKMRSSGGYYWGGYDKYIGKIEWSYNGWCFGMYKDNDSKGLLNRNALHLSSLVPGYPTSGGCIHLGTSSSKMYKKIVKIAKTNKKTIKIIYY